MRFTRKLPPNCLHRGDLPNRTPMVRGRIQRPAKLLGADEETLTAELGKVENQEQIHARMVHGSCAFFASEYLSGPEQAPYHGRFLIGKHHLAWDKILSEHRKACILAARDHGKCAELNSLIVSSDGKRTKIKDWSGGEVIAYDRKTHQLKKAFAHGSQPMGLRRCIKVTTRTGRTETVTLNHRFMMVDGEVYAEDLQLGMRIAVPKMLPVEGCEQLRPGEAWLIALLNGDGGLTVGTPSLSKNDQMVVEYARYATSKIGGVLSDRSADNRYGFKGVLDWARKIGIAGKAARSKKIPECVFVAPNDDVAEYVAGAIDTDCNINTHGGGCVEFSSTSEHLLRGLQHLLTRLGVVAVLTQKHSTYKGEPYLSWLLNVRGRSICVLAEKVKPKGLRAKQLLELAEKQAQKSEGGSVDLLPKAVYGWLTHTSGWFKHRGFPGYCLQYDLTRSKARKLATADGNKQLAELADSPVLWDEVIKLEDAGEHETYSFTVPGYETYVGQDIVNHNSHFWSLAFPIWQGGWKEPGSLGYIFSASQELAEDFLQKIKDEILNNPKLKHLIPGSKDRNWNKREIQLSNGTRIRARGWMVRVRGGHPHWIVCDDVLDDTSLYSETKRSRAVDYFFSVPVNMVIPGGILIVVGTPFHHADLYAKIKATNKYAYSVFAARNKDGEALFPDRYDEAALKDKEEEIGPARFAREFLCIPLTDEASLFPSKLFAGDIRLPYKLGLPGSYWEQRGMPRYAGVDIAFSAETGADYFVIFIIALDAQGNRWIVDIIRKHGIGFQVMKDLVKDVNTKYGCDSINIESNAAQRFLPDAMIQEEGLSNIRRYNTSGVQPKKDWKKGMTTLTVGKHSIDRGVPAMRMSLENGQWRIPRGDEYSIEMTDIWIGEMGCITFQDGKVLSVGEHDDVAMACWMADTACRMGGASFAFAGMSDTDIDEPEHKSLQGIPNLRSEFDGLAEDSIAELDRIEEIKKKGSQESFDPFGLGDL